MTARRARPPAGALHVDLTVEDLLVPAGVGDEDAVRQAVEQALREALEERLSGARPAAAGHQRTLADVRVRLGEPLATDAFSLGRQVAVEVTRVVLP